MGVTALATWASPPGRRRGSVHRLAKMASRRRFGAFVYTVATREAPRGDAGGRKSVHRSVKMAFRVRFGAFVYTVGPWAWVVGGLGIAIVYTNGRIGPLRAVLGHLCTLLRLARIVRATVGTQECTQIDGNGPPEPFFGHLCTLLRRKLRRVARAPQPPWCAGGAPSVATSRLVGKPGSARAAPSRGWRLPETLTHKPPKSQKTAWCRRTRRSVWRTR